MLDAADDTLVPWSDDEEFSGSTFDPFSSILDYRFDSTRPGATLKTSQQQCKIYQRLKVKHFD